MWPFAAFHYNFLYGLGGVEVRFLGQIPHRISRREQHFALIGLIQSGDNLQQGRFTRTVQTDDEKTVKEVVMEGVQSIVDTLAEYEEINNKFGLPEYYEDSEKMDALFARQAELQDIIDATDAWNLDSKLERAMDALRCPPEDQPVKNLSGGERRRVALCRLLLQKPDILLLDEPTNHLDAESIDWLEQHLQQYEGTVIAVTHDRYFRIQMVGRLVQ